MVEPVETTREGEFYSHWVLVSGKSGKASSVSSLSPETLVRALRMKGNLIFWELRKFDSRVGKKMKKNYFSRLFAAFAFVAVLVLSGCVQNTNSVADSLEGTWVDSYNSYYKITATTFENYGDDYESYAGDTLTIVAADETSGTIFFKYTRAADENWNYTTDASKAPDIGKWYAVSYKDLTDSSVKLSGANGTKTSSKTSCDTLDEAKEEFTIANGYFANYSECTKK